MSNDFRSKVIHLAHANPALRPHLLPLLKEAASHSYTTNPDPWPEGVPLPKPLPVKTFVMGKLDSEKDYYSNGTVWKIYRFKVDNFSILSADLQSLLRLGLTRIGTNQPGFIDLYFK